MTIKPEQLIERNWVWGVRSHSLLLKKPLRLGVGVFVIECKIVQMYFPELEDM